MKDFGQSVFNIHRVLQVRENWKKLENLFGQGKSGKVILDHADCRYM